MGIFNSWLGKSDELDEQGTSYKKSLDRALGNPVDALEADVHQRNEAVLEALDAKIMVTDNSHTIVSINPAIVEMLRGVQADIRKDMPNFNVDALVGSKIDVFHKDAAHIRKMLDGLTGRYNARIQVGSLYFDLAISPLKGADHERAGFVVEWNDATENLRLEAMLKEVESKSQESARVKSALDQSDLAMMIVDQGNHIEYCNDSMNRMFSALESDIRTSVPGFSAGKIEGTTVDSLIHDSSARGRDRAQLQFGGRTLQIRTSRLKDASGAQCGAVLEWKDKTEELKIENSIIETVENAIAGDLHGRIVITDKNDNTSLMADKVNMLLETFSNVLEETVDVLGSVANGKLTRKISSEFTGVFGKLKGDVNLTIDNLIKVINEIRETANNVKIGAEEISSGNNNLSQRTEQQAASLEETSSAMEEITSTVQQNAANAVQANTLARGARETAENGGDVVSSAVAAMDAISESSSRINDIIGVIDEIAFQTNLLALNAAVEAARAGDQGRGFAVVADEVRNLAGRSATAAKEIKDLIKDSGEKVQEGSRLVNKSGETLDEIVTAVKRVNDIVAEISTASDEQATGLDEINRAVGEMDDMTQQNAALVEEAAAASEALGGQASNMESLIMFFDLGNFSIQLDTVTKVKKPVQAAPLAGRKPPVRASAPVAKRAVAPKAAAAPKARAKAPVKEPVQTASVSKKPAAGDDDKIWEEF